MLNNNDIEKLKSFEGIQTMHIPAKMMLLDKGKIADRLYYHQPSLFYLSLLIFTNVIVHLRPVPLPLRPVITKNWIRK